MKEGGSIETDSTDRVLKKTLVDWKNDDKYSYWCPISQNLETVDSIVKLEDGRVAYLQMTVSDKRTVNVASLKTLNAILGQEKPIFIVVCQTVAAAKELAFTTRADVEEASDVCDVHVGYYGEAGIDPKMDGARNNVEADSHHCRHATHHGAVMPNQQSTTRSHRTRLSPKTAKRKRSEDGDTTGESDD